MGTFEDVAKRYIKSMLESTQHEAIERIDTLVIDYDEGYRYSSYTYQDPSFKVEVRYTRKDGTDGWHYASNESAGEFLHKLLAWEDAGGPAA